MIEADQERTFDTFVKQLAAWWQPLETRSIALGKPTDIRVENWVGGRIYEVRNQDRENVWGHITSWNPPESFSFTWEIIPGPDFTEVDLHFQRLGPALTRVVVMHHGWESLSNALLDRYAKYAGGWVLALRNFAAMFEDDPPAVRSLPDDPESR
jgi:Activator of Hsp90 ATPase homolog 1-like protein